MWPKSLFSCSHHDCPHCPYHRATLTHPPKPIRLLLPLQLRHARAQPCILAVARPPGPIRARLGLRAGLFMLWSCGRVDAAAIEILAHPSRDAPDSRRPFPDSARPLLLRPHQPWTPALLLFSMTAVVISALLRTTVWPWGSTFPNPTASTHLWASTSRRSAFTLLAPRALQHLPLPKFSSRNASSTATAACRANHRHGSEIYHFLFCTLPVNYFRCTHLCFSSYAPCRLCPLRV